MKARISKDKARRKTTLKHIAKLAKQGNILGALKVARGGAELERDPARRIINSWLAVVEMENHPDVLRQAPTGFYERTLERAAWETWNAVRQAVKQRDPDFFLRMAAKLKEPEPERDALAIAVLSEGLRVKTQDRPAKRAKEIIGAAGYAEVSDKDVRRVARLRQVFGINPEDK